MSAAFDGINYLRWGSLYLEDMKRLESTHTDVHVKFVGGNFCIKDREDKFISVGGDQKLEQSFNLS